MQFGCEGISLLDRKNNNRFGRQWRKLERRNPRETRSLLYSLMLTTAFKSPINHLIAYNTLIGFCFKLWVFVSSIRLLSKFVSQTSMMLINYFGFQLYHQMRRIEAFLTFFHFLMLLKTWYSK